MQRMLKDAKPDRFDDLIALGALYRPGPMDLIPEYVACKHGKKPEYLHPGMEQVLGVTYGVFVYQEQVMQIAQQLAGYTLGGADLLRRAMGKKKPEEMAKQRSVFVGGAAARGIGDRIANAIFDQMEKFAGYGFNKSARRRLRADLLPDRLPQGAFPRGVHGGHAVRRHGPHRQGRDADPRVRRHEAQGVPARYQHVAL